ncbi:MAG: acyl-CoA thioesterase FadM [Granulosicoccus sp.]|jgi:acyl-CoA thioesterase FadM
MLRSNIFNLIRKQGWYPVVAGETIQFKKSLKLWQKFTITTHILGRNEKSIYFEQRFTQGTDWIATATIDARFLAKMGGKLTPAQVYELVGFNQPAPELPDYVHRWKESVQLSRDAPSTPH